MDIKGLKKFMKNGKLHKKEEKIEMGKKKPKKSKK